MTRDIYVLRESSDLHTLCLSTIYCSKVDALRAARKHVLTESTREDQITVSVYALPSFMVSADRHGLLTRILQFKVRALATFTATRRKTTRALYARKL